MTQPNPPGSNDPPPAATPQTTMGGVRLAYKISKDAGIKDDQLRSTIATGALTAVKALDTVTYRLIILALTLIGVISLAFVLWLTLTGKNSQTTTTEAHGTTPATVVTVPSAAPEIFASLGSTAVGALAGLVSAKQLGKNGTTTE